MPILLAISRASKSWVSRMYAFFFPSGLKKMIKKIAKKEKGKNWIKKRQMRKKKDEMKKKDEKKMKWRKDEMKKSNKKL